MLAHLRYWPAARLERDVAAVLATSRGRARAIARALRHGRVAPADVTPSEAVSRGYFEAATFAIYRRLRDLQQARGQPERVEEPRQREPRAAAAGARPAGAPSPAGCPIRRPPRRSLPARRPATSPIGARGRR